MRFEPGWCLSTVIEWLVKGPKSFKLLSELLCNRILD